MAIDDSIYSQLRLLLLVYGLEPTGLPFSRLLLTHNWLRYVGYCDVLWSGLLTCLFPWVRWMVDGGWMHRWMDGEELTAEVRSAECGLRYKGVRASNQVSTHTMLRQFCR